MGAAQMPLPIYQYRLVFPFDDKMINVATDMDFNVEGELRTPITKNIVAKSNFLVRTRSLFNFSHVMPIASSDCVLLMLCLCSSYRLAIERA